ncbi:unnamed protein product, partial [Ectocarpus fasciculatus]
QHTTSRCAASTGQPVAGSPRRWWDTLLSPVRESQAAESEKGLGAFLPAEAEAGANNTDEDATTVGKKQQEADVFLLLAFSTSRVQSRLAGARAPPPSHGGAGEAAAGEGGELSRGVGLARRRELRRPGRRRVPQGSGEGASHFSGTAL